MMDLKCFQLEVDAEGIMTATLDVPERPLNVFDDAVLRELNEVISRAGAQAVAPEGQRVRMLVFRSGKPAGFLAGADIHRLKSIKNRQESEWIIEQGQKLFSAIEHLIVPTVAVVHGACVGGGLEFALACKYRIAVDHPSTKMGLPEVKLGLLPAWGGAHRLPKQVGLLESLPMILEGKMVSAHQAKRIGLVDELISAPDAEEEIHRFVTKRMGRVPISGPKPSWKHWLLDQNALGRRFIMSQARKKTARMAKHYPALNEILRVVSIGLDDREVTDEALAAEREGFTNLLFGDVAPHLLDLFLLQEQAKKASTWTNDAHPAEVKKLAVIGGGTMGAGIAQLAAVRGYSVVLQEVKQEYLDRGMEKIKDLCSKAVSKKAMTQPEADAALGRLTPRVDWGPSDDIDLMVEAVVERMDIKQSVFSAADERLPEHAVLASNTSALPIGEMAQATQRPDHVAGLHFFNPVHKMPLVEVVRTLQTNDDTVATLVQVAKKLGKVPIVVKQSPGFLVNRILFPYLDEAARLVVEGYQVGDIDSAAKKFGMPMGPLELLDVVGIDVALDVSQTLSPLANQETPSPDLFRKMVDAESRGQKSGHGFYQWDGGKRGGPASLPQQVSSSPPAPLPDWNIGGETFGTIQQRLVLSMLNEAQKCLNEGIVSEPWMVDLGMVLGTGFAPFRGGPMACREAWGAAAVDERLGLLKEKLGARFTPAGNAEPSSQMPEAEHAEQNAE